jgi:hypothetical protein
MELFDFIKVMFTDGNKFQKIKNSDKARHFFMVQRFMSIQYPTTAQQLNRVGMNGWPIMDLWQMVASRFKRVPGWIYTKTKKAPSEKIWKPNPEVAKLWMERNNLSDKDFRDCLRFYPEEMKKTLSSLEKQIKMYE